MPFQKCRPSPLHCILGRFCFWLLAKVEQLLTLALTGGTRHVGSHFSADSPANLPPVLAAYVDPGFSPPHNRPSTLDDIVSFEYSVILGMINKNGPILQLLLALPHRERVSLSFIGSWLGIDCSSCMWCIYVGPLWSFVAFFQRSSNLSILQFYIIPQSWWNFQTQL